MVADCCTGHSQGPGSMSPHLPHPMGPPGSQMHPPGGQMQPPVGTQNLPHHLQAPQQQQSLPMTSHPGSHEASMQPQQQQQQASMPASMAFSMGMNLSMSGLNPGGIPGMPGGISGRPPMPTLPQVCVAPACYMIILLLLQLLSVSMHIPPRNSLLVADCTYSFFVVYHLLSRQKSLTDICSLSVLVDKASEADQACNSLAAPEILCIMCCSV